MHQRRGDGGDPIGRLITAPDARRGRRGGDLGARRGFGGGSRGWGRRLCSPAFCEAAGSSRQAGKLGYLLFYFLIFPPEATGGGVAFLFLFYIYLSTPPPRSARRIGSCLKTEKGKKERKKKKFKIIPSVGEEEEERGGGDEGEGDAPRGAPGVRPLPRKRRGQRLEPGGCGRWAEGAGGEQLPAALLPAPRH